MPDDYTSFAISRSLNFWILPVRRLRQFGEHHVARAFVAREVLAAPRHQFVGRRLLPRLELDERARRLAPFLVGLRHHGGGLHGRMLVERVLDLDRGNVLAARDDDVLGAVLELDVAVGIAHAEIAGVKPAALEFLLGRRLVLEIALHHHVAAEHHLAQRLAVARHRLHGLGIEHVERLERHVAHALARLLGGLLGGGERVPARGAIR